jgi:uncharacterized protein (TIGR02145 family)
MKFKHLLLALLFFNLAANAQNVGIGTTTPNASAQLDVSSTNSGFLPPRMSFIQRNAIANPAAGLIVYCTDCGIRGEMQFFDGQQWVQMSVRSANAPFTSPILNTTSASTVTNTSAISGGNISSDGGVAVSAKGVVWSTTINPTIALSTKTLDGVGVGTFTSIITGLTPNTTYYIRAYATNEIGTAYGTQLTFTTQNSVPFDTTVPSVAIGAQIWSSKNLSVARYRNGDLIPQVTNAAEWANLTTGAWCWYNNDSASYAATYGRLYNWYAVKDPRGLAPQGWHIPTDGDWNRLAKFIDPVADTICAGCFQSNVAGNNLKKNTNWNSPNTNATNSSGFAALPGGRRTRFGKFLNAGVLGSWWSVGENNTTNACFRFLYSVNANLTRDFYRHNSLGFSVRVVRD